MPPRSSNNNGKSLRSAATTKSGPSKSAIAQHTYVADVNPAFNIPANVRCFEPVNDRIAYTAQADGTLCVRALPKGTELRRLPGREGSVCTALLYLDHLRHMWAAFEDGYIHIYDVETCRLVNECAKHTRAITSMVEVEGTVFTASADWSIVHWDAVKMTALRTLQGHRGPVRSLATYTGTTGSVLFSGAEDSVIKAWDPYESSEHGEEPMHTFSGHEDGAVVSMEVVPYANQLWSAGEDLTVRVWNLETLQCISILRSHTAVVVSFLIVESRMWSADKAGHIILWDLNTLTPLQDLKPRFPEEVRASHVFAMKKVHRTTSWKVWTAMGSGFIQCWNAETVPILFRGEKPNDTRHRQASASTLARLMTGTSAADEANGTTPYRLLDSAKLAEDMAFERGRLEVQRELQTQQLVEEENEYLLQKLRELETYTKNAALPRLKGTNASSNGVSTASPCAVVSVGDDVEPSTATTHLRRRFEGSEWSYVLNEKQHELYNTFRHEACTALGVPPAQLSRIEFQNGSLIAELDVAHPMTVPSQEMDRRFQAYGFPGLHQLHDNARVTPKVDYDASEETVIAMEQKLQEAYDENDRIRRDLSRTSPSPRPPKSVIDDDKEKRELERELAAAKQQIADLRDDYMKQQVDKVNKETELRLQREENESLLNLLNRNRGSEGSTGDQQLKEDYEALNNYVHGDLKPLVSKLKRASAEKTIDIERLEAGKAKLEDKLMAMEQEMRNSASTQEVESIARSSTSGVDDPVALRRELRKSQCECKAKGTALLQVQKELDVLKRALEAEDGPRAVVTPPVAREVPADDKYAELLQDHEALKNYVQDCLKPLVSRQERELAEAKQDKERDQKNSAVGDVKAISDKLSAAEEKAKTAEQKAKLAEDKAKNVEQKAKLADDKVKAAEQKAKTAEDKVKNIEQKAKLAEDKAKAADQKAKTAEDKAKAAEQKAKTAEDKVKSAEQKTKTAEEKARSLAATPSVPAASPQELEQLKEDYEALNNYVHGDLKPLVSKLKRASAEKTIDIERLEAEKAALEAKKSNTVDPAAHKKAMDAKEQELAKAKKENDSLKPLVARLEKSVADKDKRLRQAEDELADLHSALEAAEGAQEERNLRDQKMGEAVEAMKTELDNQRNLQQQQQGRPTIPTLMSGGNSMERSTSPALSVDGKRSDENPREVARLRSEVQALRQAATEKGSVEAQNLRLSVRLADAESVIADLQGSLDHSMRLLEDQKRETTRLSHLISDR